MISAKQLQKEGFVPLFLWGFVVSLAVNLVATAVECRGIRFFGARRRWRVDERVGWNICAHAAIGWTFAGFVAIGTVIFVFMLRTIPDVRHASVGADTLMAGLWISWLIGMLIFEVLVYLGVRQCTYANMPREESARSADPPKAEALAQSAEPPKPV
jgi:hypothetical protein